MLPLIGLAVGAAGGIMGGIGQNAAAANRNRAAQQAWIQGEMQKGIDNGKELFNASYAQQQQTERSEERRVGKSISYFWYSGWNCQGFKAISKPSIFRSSYSS